MKRFQFMNGRWVKSNKIVNFPMDKFDPSEFVVKRSNVESGSYVRTVNVQTIVEDAEQDSSQVSVETHSDEVML